MFFKPLKKLTLPLVALALVAFASSIAKAETFTFTGTTSEGDPFNVTATITQSGNQLTVVLTNNIANQVSIGQSLSGFSFQIVGHGGSGLTVVSQSGRAVVHSSGTLWTDIGNPAPDALGWSITGSGGTFTLDALGVTGPNGTNPPDETIAGVPDSANGSGVRYNSANASLQNDPHQPIVVNTATFVFTVTGLTGTAQFTNATFFLGTEGQAFVIPEPASMLLLGTGLLGVAAGVRRRMNRKQL